MSPTAVLDRVKELAHEISETADEIRERAATIQDETPPEGVDGDTRPETGSTR